MINEKEYAEFVGHVNLYKSAVPSSRRELLAILALGLNEEAGEVAGKIKKATRDVWDFPAMENAVCRELSDVLWYMTAMCNALGVTMQELRDINHDKLSDRVSRGTLQGSGDNR